MSKQAERETLLRKWSTLAPRECEMRTREGAWWLRWECRLNGSDTWHGQHNSNVPAILLLALIEAVRARGWHSAIWNDDEAFAHVKKADSELLGKAAGYEPCDALLAAYVSALVAVVEKASAGIPDGS